MELFVMSTMPPSISPVSDPRLCRVGIGIQRLMVRVCGGFDAVGSPRLVGAVLVCGCCGLSVDANKVRFHYYGFNRIKPDDGAEMQDRAKPTGIGPLGLVLTRRGRYIEGRSYVQCTGCRLRTLG